MNTRYGRTIRRAGIGAAAFFAVSFLSAPAAFAETTSDLELTVQGTSLAVGSSEKTGTFTVANHGPQAASNVEFTIDASGLDKNKVTFAFNGGDCPPTADVWDCQYTGTIDSGESWDNYFKLTKVGDATGEAGSLTITISHAQDENPSNNSKTVKVLLSSSAGVDLAAHADDIYQTTDKRDSRSSTTPVQPGATTFFWADVVNWGDTPSTKIQMLINLPEGITFVGHEDDCDYTDGSTSTLCTYGGNAGAVAPGKFTTFLFEVKVDEHVAGPVVLGNGVFKVTDVPAPAAAAVQDVQPAPANVITNRDIESVEDLDPADNTDGFSAYIGKKADPVSSGGEGGGLPVTGTRVTPIALAGASAVLLGTLLLMASRRRFAKGAAKV